jgi:tripartite ATP-independent transporter DctP family solute receptor
MKLIRFLAGVVLAGAVLAMARPAEAQKTVLRIESSMPAAHTTSRAMEIFKTEVARLSRGSVEVEVSADAPVSIRETIDAVHVGNIFATWASVGANFSRLAPELSAVSLPFIYENYDQARRSVAGRVGTLITTKLEAKGFIVLAWMELGAMQVSNSKRPLKTLEDFKDLKIRVLPNATHLAAFQAIGARPVAMDLKEVGDALRQGDVDGQELDYSLMYAKKYFQNQRYLSDTNHFMDFIGLVANRKAFMSLDLSQQKAVREAAAIAAVQQHKMSTEDQAVALMALKQEGLQFDPLPRETRVALRRATAGIVDDVRKWVGADVVNDVLAANRVAVSKSGRR